MTFHVPFEYRRKPPPIYIGFDTPPPRVRQRNRTALLGFLFSIFSIFTLGVLSPLALIVCLFGLKKRPRGLAIAGLVISLLGTSIIGSAIVGGSIADARHRERMHQKRVAKLNREKEASTMKIMSESLAELKQWRDSHDGYFPDLITANMLTIKFEDGWGQALRFETEGNQGLVRSAGADGKFDTRDDLIQSIEGKIVEVGRASIEVSTKGVPNPPDDSE